MKRNLFVALLIVALMAAINFSGVPTSHAFGLGDVLGAVTSGATASKEDVFAEALKQIDIGKEIQKKTEKLENDLITAMFRVRQYQALTGEGWVQIAKDYTELFNSLGTLDETGNIAGTCFVDSTKIKRVQNKGILSDAVKLKTGLNLNENAEIINTNNDNNKTLRELVKKIVDENADIGQNFSKVIGIQNASLNLFLNQYVQRVSQAQCKMGTAAILFDYSSKEFKKVHDDMNKAIKTYNEESAIVAVDVTKQLAILALQIKSAKDAVDQVKRNPLMAIKVLKTSKQVITDIGTLTKSLSGFLQVRKYMADHSESIKTACVTARGQIEKSSQDLTSIQNTISTMFDNQMAVMTTAAKEGRAGVINIKEKFAELQKKNKKQASQDSEIFIKNKMQSAI